MRLFVLTFFFTLLLLAWLARLSRATGDKCANVCTCKWKGGKRTVECKNRELTGVPEGLEQDTQVLDASENNIGTLTSNIFVKVRLTNLQRLYLRSCHIKQINEQAFTGLTNLVELDLSMNRLTAVPSHSFGHISFLRDLVLAHNPLRKIPAFAFQDTPNLVKLDLSSSELTELAAKSFQGLEILEVLKINHNKLDSLEVGTFEPLKKLTTIDLYENPWFCDCRLREMKSFLINQNLPTPIAPICHRPEQLVNKSFTELALDDFACRPVISINKNYAEATIGENASIECHVAAIPPARIKWIWNGKLYSNHSTVNSYQKILIYEEGQFQKKSTLVLTNAQESDSSTFFCVAENQAGSIEANFTLHVSFRTAGMSTLGSGQIAGISAALVVLILLILLTIIILFARLRRMPPKEVKSPAPLSESLPSEGCHTGNQDSNNPQSASSTVSRRKAEDIETTSFSEGKSPVPSALTNHGYSGGQRPGAQLVAESQDYLINRGYEESCGLGTRVQQSLMAPGPCYSSQASLMPIDNPDLIRDTRRGSSEEAGLPIEYAPTLAEYSRIVEVDESKLLYAECLSNWEAQNRELLCRPSVSVNPYLGKDLQMQQHALGGAGVLGGVGGVGVGAGGAGGAGGLGVLAPGPQPAAQDLFPAGAKQIRVWQKGVPVLPPVSALKRVLSTRSSPDEGYQEGTGTDV